MLVDLGYGNTGIGADRANSPTPARIFEIPNPLTIGFDLVRGTEQGPEATLVVRGLLPSLWLPDTFPYVLSLNPGLDLEFGQPSATVLSVLSSVVGSILHLISPG